VSLFQRLNPISLLRTLVLFRLQMFLQLKLR
jgi:hypothetical protein